jgi:hypothetical protein
MDEQQLQDIIDCLPKERTLFHYYKDQYAIYLLQRFLTGADGKSIRDLRQSPVKKLLEKPLLKDSLKSAGNGLLTRQQLESLWPSTSEQYVLTLGKWGKKDDYDWAQTSRPGTNLVLQLNLNNQLDALFESATGVHLNRITSSFHPRSQKRSATIAWARLDLDFVTGEVLIEEIQSDLIRDLEKTYKRALRLAAGEGRRFYWSKEFLDGNEVAKRCEHIVATQKKLWSEAMMAATLWFVHEELGFDKVYYHTFDTGKVMKKINYTAPPRSLYTDLPEKFCFELTREAPRFIAMDAKARRRLKAANNPQWFLLAN